MYLLHTFPSSCVVVPGMRFENDRTELGGWTEVHGGIREGPVSSTCLVGASGHVAVTSVQSGHRRLDSHSWNCVEHCQGICENSVAINEGSDRFRVRAGDGNLDVAAAARIK